MFNLVIEPFKSFYHDKTISIDVILFSLILLLIPFALITGPALPDIFLSIIALYFLIKSVWKKKWNYYNNLFFFIFIFFCFYGIIRSLFSDIPFESLTTEGSVFYFRYIFFALGVSYLFHTNPYLIRCFIFLTIFCIFIVSVDTFYQYFFEYNLFGNPKFNPDRLTSLFGKEPIIGRYISNLTIITFSLIQISYQNSKKVIRTSSLLLMSGFLVVFLSGERTPLFNLFLFLILILLFFQKYRKYLIKMFLILSVILLICLQFNPTAKIRMIDYSFAQISQTKLPYLPYSKEHEKIYTTSLMMFAENPLFGLGTNTFRYQCNKQKYVSEANSCSSHPHNYYIQLLSEGGIIGFLFIFLFFFNLTLIIFKKIIQLTLNNDNPEIHKKKLVSAILLFIFLFPLVPHMSFYNNWNNVFLMISLSLYMNSFHIKKINGILK